MADPHWRLRSRSLTLSGPVLMGVVNVTPDSFSDGGEHYDTDLAVAHGLALVEQGAHVVDVGGESTRPGAAGVDVDTEIGRVIPVVAALARRGVVVSVDTSKAEVAQAAVDAGAEIVNDIRALEDPAVRDVVLEGGVGVVLMHMQGTPATMQIDPHYEDVVDEVKDFLAGRAHALEQAGLDRAGIAVDPGIGFGKNVDHNLELLRRLGELVAIGYPVAIGASRKGFLGRLTGRDDPRSRDVATAATSALAVAAGAAILRVHDVAGSRDAVAVATAVSRVRI